MKSKVHITALDAVRTFCVSAVLLIHTTTRVLEVTQYNLVNHTWTLFLNQISRFAVPVFIIISGFVLEFNHHLNESFLHYLKKRVTKIFVPYLLWSFVYYFFVYTNNNDNFITLILEGSGSYQLYFIPTLCVYYILFPFLHKIYNLLSNKFVFTILLFLEIRLCYIDYSIMQFPYAEPIRIFLLSYIFFVVGMIFARNKDKLLAIVMRYKYLLTLALLPIIYYIFIEGRNGYYKTFNIESFYSQWRPSVLIYSILIFTVLFYVFSHGKRQLKIFSKLSKLSYLVFFIHVTILELVWKNLMNIVFAMSQNNYFGKIIFDPVFFLIVLTTSFGVAYLIHKVPYLNRITG